MRMRGPIAFALFLFFVAAALSAQVTLPLPQFEALRARANPDPEVAPPPPAPFALASANLSILPGRDSAQVVQTLELTLYAEGWQRVPLGEVGSFTGAELGGMEGRVETDNGAWWLVVRGQGPHRVTLRSVVALAVDETATRPLRRLSLHPPPAAVVTGLIAALPGLEEVDLEGAGLLQRTETGWLFVAAPTAEPLVFALQGKRTLPERAQLPLRFEATSATAVVLSRTQLKVQGWLSVRVAQGRLTELVIPLPPGLQVVAVGGPGNPIGGWNVVAGKLIVTPLAPVDGTFAVDFTLSGPPVATFATPLLAPEGSRRTLFLARATLQGGDGLLTLADPEAVRQAAEAETAGLPEAIRTGGPLVAVLDPARPPRWQAEWADGTAVLAAQVDRLLVDAAVGESGRASYQVWIEVRNRGAQQLTVTFPPGFELVGASRDGDPVAPGAVFNSAITGAEVAARVVKPTVLAVPLTSGDAVQVVYLSGLLPLPVPQPGRSGDFALPLPSLSAPAARVEVELVLPGGRTYALADPSRAHAIAPPPGAGRRDAERSAILTSNVIAQQVLAAPAFGSNLAGSLAALYEPPPGFITLVASWSALSADPAPLAIRVKGEKESPSWF